MSEHKPRLQQSQNVIPKNIEEIIRQHPAVRGGTVFGTLRDIWVETPLAAGHSRTKASGKDPRRRNRKVGRGRGFLSGNPAVAWSSGGPAELHVMRSLIFHEDDGIENL